MQKRSVPNRAAGCGPKAKRPKASIRYRLWAAKVQYGMQIASIFSCVFKHPHAWEQFYAASDNNEAL